MTPGPAVQAEDAVHRYAPERGVDGVSVSLERGGCLALLGRNGSGKTTLTRLVLGLERLEGGRIRVLGGPPPAGDRRRLARVGASLERPVHWENLTGWQNGMFALRAYGWSGKRARGRIGEWLERAGLLDQAGEPVRTYSLGMRRKLGLIQALAPDPELLVLDEPTAGLDAPFEAELAGEIRSRCRAGRSTWVAGNDPEWVAGLGGRVAILHAGRLVAEDTAEALIAEASPWRRVEVTLARPWNNGAELKERPGVRSVRIRGREVEALLSQDPRLVPSFLADLAEQGGEVSSLEVRGGTLRDALLFKTGSER